MLRRIVFGTGALIILGVAYYGISPLFRNIRIDEAAPLSKKVISVTPTTKEVEPTILTAPVTGTTGHPGSGTARIITTDTGTVIRYENFKTLNGPDLYVYLSKDLKAHEYVSLGELKATEGNINYDVPDTIDVNDYRYVMVWCKQFGVLFNYADLSATR